MTARIHFCFEQTFRQFLQGIPLLGRKNTCKWTVIYNTGSRNTLNILAEIKTVRLWCLIRHQLLDDLMILDVEWGLLDLRVWVRSSSLPKSLVHLLHVLQSVSRKTQGNRSFHHWQQVHQKLRQKLLASSEDSVCFTCKKPPYLVDHQLFNGVDAIHPPSRIHFCRGFWSKQDCWTIQVVKHLWNTRFGLI